MQAAPEQLFLQPLAAPAGHAVMLDLDPGHQAVAAQVVDARHVLEREDRIEEVVDQPGSAREQVLALIDVHGRQAGSAGGRVGGIGVAVEELDGVFRRRRGHGLVDLVAHGNSTHRLSAIGDRLGHGHDVRLDAEGRGPEGCAQAAETGDDLIEHQEQAVLVADFAQALKIALRGHQCTG